MRVFVLCAGRTASTAFSKAAGHIDGFTSGHETRSRLVAYNRTDYCDCHIEVDNRLSWFLGTLDKKYGNQAYYVKLIRDDSKISKSYLNRWHLSVSIVKAFMVGILMNDYYTKTDRENACELYVQTVNDNIEHFLKDKSKVFYFDIEKSAEEFKRFCDWLDVECPVAGIAEWNVVHNPNSNNAYFTSIKKIPRVLFKKVRQLFI